MANPFVHLELNTPNLEKAKSFYKEMFQWSFQDMDMGPGGTYSVFKPDDGPGGGMMSMPQAPTHWLPYIGVDDVKAATEKAKSLGATMMMENHEVPDMGCFSIMTDPTGAMVAIWQPKAK
jgi:predicted enzyme related to lactoylglutathione lyase